MTESRPKRRSKTGEPHADITGLRWLRKNRSSGSLTEKQVKEMLKKNFGVDVNTKGANTDELKEKK